jgi:hypothetical protein
LGLTVDARKTMNQFSPEAGQSLQYQVLSTPTFAVSDSPLLGDPPFGLAAFLIQNGIATWLYCSHLHSGLRGCSTTIAPVHQIRDARRGDCRNS